MQPTRTIRFALALFFAPALFLFGTTMAPAADPFYEQLLRKGLRDHGRGDFESAAKSIRIACFGFLEEPPLLAECLIRLGLAQAALQNRDGFGEAFERIVELEERFGVYSTADLPTAKSEFEQRVLELIPEQDLRLSPPFSGLLQSKVRDEIDTLPPREQREKLETLVAAEPGNRIWLSRLAQLEWEQGRARKAAGLLDQLLALEPGDRQALCRRGQVAVDLKECDPATAGLPSCTSFPEDSDSAAFYLDCLVRSDRLEEARILLSQLSAEFRGVKRIRRIEKRLLAAESPTDALQVPRGAEESTADPDEERVILRISADDEKTMLYIRNLIDSAATTEQLEEPFRLAEELAEARPDSSEAQFLAAEIAYLSSQWEDAVDFFRRGGEPPFDRPVLAFYLAVSLFEAGHVEEATRVLSAILPSLARTSLVDSYAARILEEETTESDGSQ